MDTLHEREYTRTECIIAVVDVLNQHKEIMAIKATASEEMRKEAFGRTINRRDTVHWVVQDAINQIRGNPSNEDLANYNETQIAFYQTCVRELQLHTYNFSDTTISYLRLDQKTDGIRLKAEIELAGIYSMLFAAGVCVLECLSQRIPVRGGVAEGIGYVAKDSNEVYGPAFLDAYDIEQTLAQSPRILIAPSLVEIADTESGEKLLAKACLALLYQDDDGFHVIDYLNNHFQQIISNFAERARRAKAFVDAEYQKFSGAFDLKLSPRYFRLKKYFASRLT